MPQAFCKYCEAEGAKEITALRIIPHGREGWGACGPHYEAWEESGRKLRPEDVQPGGKVAEGQSGKGPDLAGVSCVQCGRLKPPGKACGYCAAAEASQAKEEPRPSRIADVSKEKEKAVPPAPQKGAAIMARMCAKCGKGLHGRTKGSLHPGCRENGEEKGLLSGVKRKGSSAAAATSAVNGGKVLAGIVLQVRPTAGMVEEEWGRWSAQVSPEQKASTAVCGTSPTSVRRGRGRQREEAAGKRRSLREPSGGKR